MLIIVYYVYIVEVVLVAAAWLGIPSQLQNKNNAWNTVAASKQK